MSFAPGLRTGRGWAEIAGLGESGASLTGVRGGMLHVNGLRRLAMADRWLTFDCYGTVADWNSGMGGALAGLAGVSGADAGRLLTAYHQAELEIEADPELRAYREVLTAGLARAAERERVRLPRGGEGAFVRGWPDIPVFDDAGPALATLKE